VLIKVKRRGYERRQNLSETNGINPFAILHLHASYVALLRGRVLLPIPIVAGATYVVGWVRIDWLERERETEREREREEASENIPGSISRVPYVLVLADPDVLL
jgi:hypothetical protein